jgi:TPR repeat protein
MLAVSFAGSAAAGAIPKTEEEALAYFEREAERGDPVSQYLLGFWYLKGDGLPQNYGEAMRWFRRAADQGDHWSQFSIGELYLKGNGVPQDYVQAHMWLQVRPCDLRGGRRMRFMKMQFVNATLSRAR